MRTDRTSVSTPVRTARPSARQVQRADQTCATRSTSIRICSALFLWSLRASDGVRTSRPVCRAFAESGVPHPMRTLSPRANREGRGIPAA